MGNSITNNVKIGTIGELFVQLRLLEMGVQSAPPIKDSGNDLIAIRGEVVKFIQIKTTENNSWDLSSLPEVYHLVALVKLEIEDSGISFDKSKIYFIEKGQSIGKKEILTNELVKRIWE